MSTPQSGMFAVGTTAHGYAEFDLKPSASIGTSKWAPALAELAMRQTTMGAANLVIGVRPELWGTVGVHPEGLTGFSEAVTGPDGFVMPATQHDIALWFSAGSYDVVFDAVLGATRTLGPFAELFSDLQGWPYRRDRDLTGFEDGTENPTLAQAPLYAVVPERTVGAGGSVMLLQKWRHDPAWLALAEAAQERAMGRTKSDSIELEPKPPSSHISRTDQDEVGHILRRNQAYGTVSDHGTIFVGFAASRVTLQTMLERMAGIGGPRDELTRFAAPLTGAYYWVPPASDIAGLAPPVDVA